jgi:hypothetical protein
MTTENSPMFPIQAVNDLELAFGGQSLDTLMPRYADLPDEFKRGRTEWNKLFSDWFYCGIATLELDPKEGVDKAAALRHIKAVMVSFEPKHEHKEAGVAFLLDQWFTNPRWTRKEKA